MTAGLQTSLDKREDVSGEFMGGCCSPGFKRAGPQVSGVREKE
jgi:hypothetical protein